MMKRSGWDRITLLAFHSNRGLVLLASGFVDDAIAAHEKAIKLNPKSAAAHSNLSGPFGKYV